MHMQHAHFSIQMFVSFHSTAQPRMSLLEDFAKAIEQGDSTQIESLLASGSIDVNARLPREFNPPPLVRISVMLVNAGASIAGEQLCAFAAKGAGAIQALLNRGVVVNQLRDSLNLNYTPLHVIANRTRHAWSADSDAGVRMLVDVCGVDLEARSVAGSSPTHIAATTGNETALRCFITAGADVDCVDRGQRTPLHATSAYNCAILLLAAGANVNARDREGRTAFQLAVRWKSTALMSALIAAGADPSDVQSVGDISIEQVESARRDIAKSRLDFVRHRAWQVCIGLQWRELDALQMCVILRHACGPVAQLISFHQWWKIATTVKHFKSKSTSTGSTGTL
jgi:ankyrin repeat protein